MQSCQLKSAIQYSSIQSKRHISLQREPLKSFGNVKSRLKNTCKANHRMSDQLRVPRRPLGATGMEVSIVGFGSSPLGGVYSEDLDVTQAIQSVHEAFKCGINLFDTSPYYGITKAETNLGRAIATLPRSEIIIATKVGRYGPSEFDFTRERVQQSVVESMSRLGVDYLDIVQCHDIEFGDLHVVITQAIPALQELKEKGVVRAIGVTGLPLDTLIEVVERVPPGTLDLVLSYCHYNLIDNTLCNYMTQFQQAGISVLNASPLSMGLLTASGPPPWHPAPTELQLACQQAAQCAEQAGVSIEKLAIQEALKYDKVPSTLIGMCTVQQVHDNVKAAMHAVGMNTNQNEAEAANEANALQQIKQILQPVQNMTWPSGKE